MHVHSITTHTSQREQPKYPSGDATEINCSINIQQNVIQLQKGVTTWMNLKNILLREKSQTQKVPYYMILFLCIPIVGKAIDEMKIGA
jgi:hypothetical protein